MLYTWALAAYPSQLAPRFNSQRNADNPSLPTYPHRERQTLVQSLERGKHVHDADDVKLVALHQLWRVR